MLTIGLAKSITELQMDLIASTSTKVARSDLAIGSGDGLLIYFMLQCNIVSILKSLV